MVLGIFALFQNKQTSRQIFLPSCSSRLSPYANTYSISAKNVIVFFHYILLKEKDTFRVANSL